MLGRGAQEPHHLEDLRAEILGFAQPQIGARGCALDERLELLQRVREHVLQLVRIDPAPALGVGDLGQLADVEPRVHSHRAKLLVELRLEIGIDGIALPRESQRVLQAACGFGGEPRRLRAARARGRAADEPRPREGGPALLVLPPIRPLLPAARGLRRGRRPAPRRRLRRTSRPMRRRSAGPARSGTARSLRTASLSGPWRIPGRLLRSPASRAVRLLLVRRLDLVGRENRRRPRGDARYLPRRIQFERRRLRFTHVNLVADDFFVRKEIGRRCGRRPQPVTARTLDRARPGADEDHRRPVPDTTQSGAREGNRDGQGPCSGRKLAPLASGKHVRDARARRPAPPRARQPKADRDTRPGERPSPTPARAHEQRRRTAALARLQPPRAQEATTEFASAGRAAPAADEQAPARCPGGYVRPPRACEHEPGSPSVPPNAPGPCEHHPPAAGRRPGRGSARPGRKARVWARKRAARNGLGARSVEQDPAGNAAVRGRADRWPVAAVRGAGDGPGRRPAAAA